MFSTWKYKETIQILRKINISKSWLIVIKIRSYGVRTENQLISRPNPYQLRYRKTPSPPWQWKQFNNWPSCWRFVKNISVTVDRRVYSISVTYNIDSKKSTFIIIIRFCWSLLQPSQEDKTVLYILSYQLNFIVCVVLKVELVWFRFIKFSLSFWNFSFIFYRM